MGFVVLVLTSSVQLFGITENLLRVAVGVSTIPAVACGVKSFKELLSHDHDNIKKSEKTMVVSAGLTVISAVTYAIGRRKIPAGRLKAVTSELEKLGKSRFVTSAPAEHIQAHTQMPRLLSLEQEGRQHTSHLELMHTELAKAHADATEDKDQATLNQIEDRQATVTKYQHNVSENLELTRGRIREQMPH